MNKFQKIAVQMAKDDLNKKYSKELRYDFRESRNDWYRIISNKNEFNIKKALGLKNYNKNLEW